MRGFRSNQRGRVQPVEYHDPKAPAQPQRYGARHRPRSAGASSRRYGSSRWPKHQYPAYPQYAGANQAAGRPSSSRPGSAPVNRPRQPSSANVDAWLRARHAAAPSSGYGQQRSYGQSSGYGQRIRAAVAAQKQHRAAAPPKKEERREYYQPPPQPVAAPPRPASASSQRHQVANNDTAHALLRQQEQQAQYHQQTRQEYVPPSQPAARPPSAASARGGLGTDQGYVVEREVSAVAAKPQRPQSASAARPAAPPVAKPAAFAGFAGKASRPQSAGAARRPAPPTEWKQPSVDDQGAAFKSGTQRPQSAGGNVRRRSSGKGEEYQCAPEQRDYLSRLLVQSTQSRRGLPDFYSFGKVIGVGSFGTVRIAWHKLTGQKVAIKTYERSKMKDPQQWKRVQQEARVMEKLSDSTLICRFLEAFETVAPRRAHLVMEFLPGGNLCSYVKAKRRIPEVELQPLLVQLGTAVDHMHSLNIVHRDIKLENIIFSDERHKIVRFIDFGFSTRCAPDRRLRLFCGTPSYMAPEIVRRTEYRGKPIDLWSFGVVAYACLGGHFPFAARSQPDLYRKILRGTCRLPEGCSSGAAALLQSCLVVDVGRRITAPDLRRHPFVQAGLVNGQMAGAHVGALTRSRNPEHDLRREAAGRVEALGVPKEALRAAVCRGEHTPLTSCYYLLMDSMGIRERPNQPPPPVATGAVAAVSTVNAFAKGAPADKENAAPAQPAKPAPVNAEQDKPPALVV